MGAACSPFSRKASSASTCVIPFGTVRSLVFIARLISGVTAKLVVDIPSSSSLDINLAAVGVTPEYRFTGSGSTGTSLNSIFFFSGSFASVFFGSFTFVSSGVGVKRSSANGPPRSLSNSASSCFFLSAICSCICFLVF